MFGKIDKSLQHAVCSGNHTARFPVKDMEDKNNRVFKYQEGRVYKHFTNFQPDPVKDLDISKVYVWITDHKKKLSLGVKAR